MSTPTSDYHKPPVAPSGMEHDALPPGTRFGEFEIKRVLGVGGFGIVYLAHDHSLEREVALKEYMPASLAARGQGPQITVRSSSLAETYAIGLRSFVNEARLLARFDHPSLVKVYRFWEDNATAYMVMPFYRGDTLRQALAAIPAGVDFKKTTVMALAVTEEEVSGIGADNVQGTFTCMGYFQSLDGAANKQFVSAFKARYGAQRVTGDVLECAYTAVYLWKAGVEKAKSFDVDKVVRTGAPILPAVPTAFTPSGGSRANLTGASAESVTAVAEQRLSPR